MKPLISQMALLLIFSAIAQAADNCKSPELRDVQRTLNRQIQLSTNQRDFDEENVKIWGEGRKKIHDKLLTRDVLAGASLGMLLLATGAIALVPESSAVADSITSLATMDGLETIQMIAPIVFFTGAGAALGTAAVDGDFFSLENKRKRDLGTILLDAHMKGFSQELLFKNQINHGLLSLQAQFAKANALLSQEHQKRLAKLSKTNRWWTAGQDDKKYFDLEYSYARSRIDLTKMEIDTYKQLADEVAKACDKLQMAESMPTSKSVVSSSRPQKRELHGPEFESRSGNESSTGTSGK